MPRRRTTARQQTLPLGLVLPATALLLLALGYPLVRQVVLSRPLLPRRAVRPIPEVNREAYTSLAHGLANLNQVARRLNERGADEPQTQELVAVLTLLAREVRELQASVLGTSLTAPEA